MAQLTINYTATSDLMTSPTSWMTSNVASSTYDNTTQQGTFTLNDGVATIGNSAFLSKSALLSITIPEGITSLGSWAIGSCSNITSINLPNSLSDIGIGALAQNPLLTTVNLPTSLTNLGASAFTGCTSLTSINLPPTLTTLNENVFANCTNLSSIDLSNITNILSNAFSNCTSLTLIDLSNVIQINGAFNGCTGLTGKLNLPKCEILETTAFNGCTGITEINAPSLISIQSNMYATAGAFSNCTGLTKIVLVETLTSIGRSAFSGCTNLLSVTCEATTPPTLGSNNFTASGDTLYVPASSVSAYQADSAWSSAFTTIEAMPPEIHYTATADLKSFSTWLTNNVDQNASTWDSGTGEGVLVLNSGVIQIGDNAFQNCTALLTMELPDEIISIRPRAFKNCTNLSSITFPETLRQIYNGAFNYCSSLTEITLPSSLEYLPGTSASPGAFYNCSNLRTIYCNVGGIPNYGGFSNVFGKYTPITNLIFKDTITQTSISFGSCTTLTNITWPSSLTFISAYEFMNCTGLTSLVFPNSLTTIDTQAFNGCSGLTSISIPDSVTSIRSTAFQGCSGLISITVGSNNVTYNDGGGNNCIIQISNHTLILGCSNTIIPNSVTTIGSSAFQGCTGLTSISIPDSVTSIESVAFDGCTNLSTFTIPDSVTTIGSNTFNNTAWLNSQSDGVVTKDGWIIAVKGNTIESATILSTKIASGAFNNVTSLKYITIANNITSITGGMFNGCSNIETVEFDENSSLTTINGEQLQYTFGPSTKLTRIDLPSSLTTIKRWAFNGLTNLTSVTCKATTPPTLESNNFTASDDTLYMPIASKSAYQSASNWSTAFTYYKGLCEISTSTDGNGTITPTELVAEGESFTVTVTPNAHYKVSHFVVDGVDVGTIDNYTFQNLNTDHIIHVDFELITHTITATAYEGGAIVPSGVITVNEGENQSFDIVPLEGYGILALFIDGTQIEPVETYTFTDVEADHTIQAMFYKLRTNGFNRDEMLDINYLLQDYLEQLKKRD